ncbi:MAG: oxidoreductase [Microbacteriaceae bacterium]|jgi:ferredoxin|nr:oxidoreductase [Microbacteriaceae bacterium]
MIARTLHIDWTRCDGRGLCTELLAGLLDRDEWGYPRALGYGSDVPIRSELMDAARESIALCPLQALSLRY